MNWVGVIETLKERISSHRDILSANEYRTRVSLIDPLLCALGWDTADPALVTLEYVVGGKKADYALLGPHGNPQVFLEAKNLSESLSKHRSQVLGYASELGIRFPALTNGDHWEIYDNSMMVPVEDRRILDVSISSDDVATASLKFLLLWRTNVTTGEPQSAAEPIVKVTQASLPEPVSKSTGYPHAGLGKGWTSLQEFEGIRGSEPPQFIRFGTEKEHKLGRWNGILIELAEHLVSKGILTADKCPCEDWTQNKTVCREYHS